MQERRIPTQELIRKRIFTSNPLRAYQQCEVPMLEEDKNKNGKRIPKNVRETQITGKKCSHPINSKRRGITFEPFERPSTTRSHYAKRK